MILLSPWRCYCALEQEIIQTMAAASADEVSGTQTDGIDGLQQVDRTLRKFLGKDVV